MIYLKNTIRFKWHEWKTAAAGSWLALATIEFLLQCLIFTLHSCHPPSSPSSATKYICKKSPRKKKRARNNRRKSPLPFSHYPKPLRIYIEFHFEVSVFIENATTFWWWRWWRESPIAQFQQRFSLSSQPSSNSELKSYGGGAQRSHTRTNGNTMPTTNVQTTATVAKQQYKYTHHIGT